MSKVFITGDTHGNFERIKYFCQDNHTTKDDVMIILGDAGINYYLNRKDKRLKEWLSQLPITLFSIRGNHEERPENIITYEIREFWSGQVYVEPEYPNFIFAKDGEIYNINGNKCLVIGGAYSVDKFYRLSMGYRWFKDEQLSTYERAEIEKKVIENDYKFDYIFSHTCPYNTRPTHLFLEGIDQSTVDSSMEEWLQEIADKIDFKKWYFGHFHDDWGNGKYQMLYENVIELEDGESNA